MNTGLSEKIKGACLGSYKATPLQFQNTYFHVSMQILFKAKDFSHCNVTAYREYFIAIIWLRMNIRVLWLK